MNTTVISFKLETDKNILEQKVKDSIKKYDVDMVVGNVLETRRK
jgi:phosphopantothenate-cysteine ligase